MAPQYVKAFVQGNKTDARDAAAICEAAIRESIPTVPVRSRDSQQIQSIHRVREAWSKQRTATINQLRGLLSEFGFVMPARVKVGRAIWDWKAASGQEFGYLNGLLDELLAQLQQLEERIGRIDKQLQQILRDNAACRLIETVPGIGPITATAIVGCVGNAENFKDSRKFACALGLTPREHSSGGKQVLLGISKRGNGYLRKLLVHGARAVLNAKLKKAKDADDWVVKLAQRRGHNIAVCALAAKNARRVWAMLRTGEVFRSDYASALHANA
jgi:transposase